MIKRFSVDNEDECVVIPGELCEGVSAAGIIVKPQEK